MGYSVSNLQGGINQVGVTHFIILACNSTTGDPLASVHTSVEESTGGQAGASAREKTNAQAAQDEA